MINKDSIVTAYDEHLTLVEWLQKVENALNSAVLTNLGIAKLSDKDNVATYQVTATFADNTTIASDSFNLPSTDIVTAFNNLATLVKGFDSRIATNTNNVNSILDIIDIVNNKINPDVLKNSIQGDDDVIVDVDNDENNENWLGIHLSPELQEKLARVLLKPSSAPTTRKVVTIDTHGAQDNVDGTELTTLMSNIVDSQGHKRFVDFGGTLGTLEGMTISYAKASLSGTHIMFVTAGTFAQNTSIPEGQKLVTFTLPSYIINKIIPVWGNGNIEKKNILLISDDWSNQTIGISLSKWPNYVLIATTQNLATTAKRHFRIQFDLLIDSD